MLNGPLPGPFLYLDKFVLNFFHRKYPPMFSDRVTVCHARDVVGN
jgi:hypothetical protein